MLDTFSPARRRAATLGRTQAVRSRRTARQHRGAACGRRPAEAARPEVLALFRSALEHGRDLARAALEANGGGPRLRRPARVHRRRTDPRDPSLRRHLCSSSRPTTSPANAASIAAVGGYGRATLAPGSDIDLLFPAARATRPARRSVDHPVHPLCAVGPRPESRPFDPHRRGMPRRGARRHDGAHRAPRGAFPARRRAPSSRPCARVSNARSCMARRPNSSPPSSPNATPRIARAGRSRYLVEPQRQGRQGRPARPQHACSGSRNMSIEVREAAELVGAGLFSRAEYRLFCRCEEFLWRVRCHLHFMTGRPEERLTFDLSARSRRRLGYSTRGGLASVERFMKHYFLVAKDVGDLTAIVCAALEEQQAKPHAMLDRFGPFLPAPSRHRRRRFRHRKRPRDGRRAGGFRARIRSISSGCSGSPIATGLPIHPDATRLVTRSLKRIDAKLRANPEANRLFLDILTSRNTPEIVLRLMNEAGVLGRFIPDFGKIVAMMQFNMYHHYTVDEHLLRAVGNLADIEQQRFSGEHPLASEILPSINNRTALYRRPVPARHRQGAHGGPFDRRRRGRARALPAPRPQRRGDRDRRLADREPSRHVGHGAAARSRRPQDDR